MKLELESVTVRCIIGERDYERREEREITLDIGLDVDERPSVTDDIADAVDYVVLVERLREGLAAAKCRLIESAAAKACEICLSFTGVRAARVKVRKTGCVPGVGCCCAVCSKVAGSSMS